MEWKPFKWDDKSTWPPFTEAVVFWGTYCDEEFWCAGYIPYEYAAPYIRVQNSQGEINSYDTDYNITHWALIKPPGE